MEKTHRNLLPFYGIGSFMAGQIVADLRWAIRNNWADRFCWAPMGPGSKRGLNRFLDQPVKASMSQDQFQDGLERVIKLCKKSLNLNFWDRLEAIDYQNCLCEYDKYSRVLLGEGKPKQRFAGI